jgi:hypothetical protein
MPDETPDPTDEELPDEMDAATVETADAAGTDGPASADGAASADDGETPTDPSSVLADDAIGRSDTLPEDVVEEAERLTRLAREAAVEAEREAYLDHREELLGAHDYTARIREDDTGDVLVLHPDRWVEAGAIRTERIEDVSRGIEVSLSGPGTGDDWAEIDAYNRAIVENVREEHDETHAANAAALADFAGNHYAKPLTELAAAELQEFVEDYFRRNAWPTDEQREVVEKSVELAFDVADERCPSWRRR